MLLCKTSPSLIRPTRLSIRTAFSRWNCLGKQYHEFNIFPSKLIRFCAKSFKYKINENARRTFARAFGELLLFCATQTWDIMIFWNLQPKSRGHAELEQKVLCWQKNYILQQDTGMEGGGWDFRFGKFSYWNKWEYFVIVFFSFPQKLLCNFYMNIFLQWSSAAEHPNETNSYIQDRGEQIVKNCEISLYRSRHGVNLFLISLHEVCFVCRSCSFLDRLPTDCTFSRQRVMFDAGLLFICEQEGKDVFRLQWRIYDNCRKKLVQPVFMAAIKSWALLLLAM